jgi:hypothetical protein
MTGRILVSEIGRTDRVTAVIIPMDGATRIPICAGIEVQLWNPDRNEALPTRLIRNLSGQWVLLNASADQDLVFRILTDHVRYRGPVVTTFNPKREGRPDKVVALQRRPDASFDDIATLVRGVVVQRDQPGTGQAVPQEGVRISVSGAGLIGHQFPIITDDRGSFALIVCIRRPGPDEAPTTQARMHFEKDGALPKDLDVTLKHGITHVFSSGIDLDETVPIGFTHE